MDSLRLIKSIKLMNHGSSVCEKNPWLSQKIMAKGIKMNPSEATAYFNLGITLHMQKRPEAAIRAYQVSLKTENCPHQSVRNNLSQDLLLAGKFKEGWAEYESRLKDNEHQFFKHHFGEAWEGTDKENKLPKSLILVCEQGFGDTIQFCRFALLLEELGVEIALFCQRSLITLLKESSQINYITDELSSKEISQYNNWCPLLSLPKKLGLENTPIEIKQGYLKADQKRVDKWSRLLIRRANHKLVGLHWQGNPNFEKKLYSKGRSMDFGDLLNLKRLENVEFVSLQKGEAQNQLKTKDKLLFVKGQMYFNSNFDFRDTAAVIAQCDLVITTDNVIAHLAGALGVQTWVALQWIPEWRWGLEGEETKWYSNMKLFRQSFKGDWKGVVNTMNNEIEQFLKI